MAKYEKLAGFLGVLGGILMAVMIGLMQFALEITMIYELDGLNVGLLF